MATLHIQLPPQPAITYPISIGTNLLSYPEQWLPLDWHSQRVVIITDDTINLLYGKSLASTLSKAKPLLLTFAAGERSKNYQIKHYLEEQMLQHHCDRNTLILALGGGVVGDMAGFIASTYLRGIPHIQLPTTLLAMVDSSVGGKTAINTTEGKNLIGTFWQPIAVVADINCLTTLPPLHLINGLIEAIKMFITHDAEQFYYVDHHLESILGKEPVNLNHVIECAIKIKTAIVAQDEKENHQRVVLNFGHTIGHALEKVTDYQLLHGHAVALGILVETKIAELLGFLASEVYQIIQTLFLRLNISGKPLTTLPFEKIIQATQYDKKTKVNQAHYVLLQALGQVYQEANQLAHPVSNELVKTALLTVSQTYAR